MAEVFAEDAATASAMLDDRRSRALLGPLPGGIGGRRGDDGFAHPD
jgi:hypothetical protein